MSNLKTGTMKWILTERELNVPEYSYSESFKTLKKAQERMSQMYHDVAIDGNKEMIESATLDKRSASVVLVDGNEIWWDIEKV